MSNYTENHITEDQNHAWNKILKFIPDNSQVLDIGCSSGNLGELLAAEKNCIVDGVEMDKKDADLALKKLRKVWNCDIETAVGKISNKYDVLIFADVLEHLTYPDEVLRAVSGLLKPRGRIVFSVPNMAHISVRLAILSGDWKYTETGLLDKTHLHYWDMGTIKDVFNRANMNLQGLDAVVYKYPEKLIQDKLSNIGLKANEKGLNLLNSKEASAFQIVGFAEINKSKHSDISLPEPVLQKDISYMAQYLTDHINKVEEYVKLLEIQRDKLGAQRDSLETQRDRLDVEIKDIKNKFYYKAINKLSHFKSKFQK